MSRPSNAAPILITMGEPAGIGPEIAVAAYKALGGRIGARPLTLVGDPQVFSACGFGGETLATKAPARRVPGKADAANAAAVIEAIETAVALAARGEAAALVTRADQQGRAGGRRFSLSRPYRVPPGADPARRAR
ncbi:MAG: hypothetical protein WDM81_21310 [Rhizomicrobium sp.]